MTRYSMSGLFWQLVGQTGSYARAPGSIGTTVDPSLYELIDEAILEMVSRAHPVHCRDIESITLTGASSYSLPTDFLDYQGVSEPIRIAGKGLIQASQGDIDALDSDPNYSDTNMQTIYWYELGVQSGARKIAFYPNPTSGTAKLFHIRKPATLTSLAANSTEYPDLPARFHRAPVMYAAALYFQYKREKPGENQDPGAWLAFFDKACEELRQETDEQLRKTYRGTIPDFLTGAVDDWMDI